MTATEDRMQAAFDKAMFHNSPTIMRVQIAADVADQMVAEAISERETVTAALLARVEALTKALQKIIDADDDFRRSLPPDWDNDPVTDACHEACAALAATAEG